MQFYHSMNNVIYGKKTLVPDCTTLAYRKGNTVAKLNSQTLARARQKAALYSEIRKERNKPGISTLLRMSFEPLRLREEGSHDLSSRPRNLNNRQTLVLVTHKAATYANNFQMRCSKSGTKTNRHNFASSSLEYIKLKASTLIFHVINWKS